MNNRDEISLSQATQALFRFWPTRVVHRDFLTNSGSTQRMSTRGVVLIWRTTMRASIVSPYRCVWNREQGNTWPSLSFGGWRGRGGGGMGGHGGQGGCLHHSVYHLQLCLSTTSCGMWPSSLCHPARHVPQLIMTPDSPCPPAHPVPQLIMSPSSPCPPAHHVPWPILSWLWGGSLNPNTPHKDQQLVLTTKYFRILPQPEWTIEPRWLVISMSFQQPFKIKKTFLLITKNANISQPLRVYWKGELFPSPFFGHTAIV